MAKMVQGPKTKTNAKKSMSPVVVVVVVVVLLAIIAVVYTKFGKDKQGMDTSTQGMKEVQGQVNQFVGTIDPAKVEAWKAKRLKEGRLVRQRKHAPPNQAK